MLIAYSVAGMLGLGIFAVKMVTTRLANMETIKTKSRVPVLHKNMKRVGIAGIIGTTLYTYGLW